jgi:hypothetical protein
MGLFNPTIVHDCKTAILEDAAGIFEARRSACRHGGDRREDRP